MVKYEENRPTTPIWSGGIMRVKIGVLIIEIPLDSKIANVKTTADLAASLLEFHS